MLRYGQASSSEYGLIDKLNLTCDGNQLQSVKDNATHSVFGNGMEFKDGANQTIEYGYDKNGNLSKDSNKNISVIQYNLLNLPSRIEFENGHVVSNVYDAGGAKLRTTHTMGNEETVTNYCGNVIYENGTPVKLLTEAGYVTLDDSKYHYFIQDLIFIEKGSVSDSYIKFTNDKLRECCDSEDTIRELKNIVLLLRNEKYTFCSRS